MGVLHSINDLTDIILPFCSPPSIFDTCLPPQIHLELKDIVNVISFLLKVFGYRVLHPPNDLLTNLCLLSNKLLRFIISLTLRSFSSCCKSWKILLWHTQYLIYSRVFLFFYFFLLDGTLYSQMTYSIIHALATLFFFFASSLYDPLWRKISHWKPPSSSSCQSTPSKDCPLPRIWIHNSISIVDTYLGSTLFLLRDIQNFFTSLYEKII